MPSLPSRYCLRCGGTFYRDDHQCKEGGFCVSISNREKLTESSTGGKKGVKPERFCFIPTQPLMEVARTFGYGVQKYGDTPDDPNWRKGYEWSKNFDALMRHAWAFWSGEDKDESGHHHLAHAAWHCIVLMQYSMEPEKYKQFDDRAEKP